MRNYNVAVAGTGYVGPPIAVLLVQHNHVTAVDIISEREEMINCRIPLHPGCGIEEHLATREPDLPPPLDGPVLPMRS